MTPEELHSAVRSAVFAKDQAALNDVAMAVGFGAATDEAFKRELYAALATADHDVQQYWTGRCGCHEHDEPQERIIACRPVVVPERIKHALAAQGQVLQVYPGSTKGSCSECRQAIWIGPRQQEALTDNKEGFRVMCMVCAVQAVAALEADGEAFVTSLNNPFVTSLKPPT